MKPDADPGQVDPTEGPSELLVLVRGAQARASNEFERLYAGTVPALVAWSRLRLSSLPHRRIDVEDIMQETWVRAFENFAGFRSGASFRHWVIGIAQNVLLEALRRDVRQRKDPLRNKADSRLSQCPDSVTSISRAAARDDGFARLLELILELAADDRQLVLLHALEERPLAKVAERLEISEDAAGKRWQRLRARLQEQPAFVSIMHG